MRDDQRRLIDEAIDDTARALTEGQPHATLRTNIAAWIAGHQSSPWRLGWVAASAVAAVVIIAVLMWPGTAKVDRMVGPADVQTRGADVPGVSADDVASDEVPPVGRALSGSPGEPNRVRPTNGPLAIATRESVEPIVIDPIELNAMAVDELEVPMLSVEAMIPEPLIVQ